MKTKAILNMNLGGPETQKDVKGFLYRLFADPEVIRVKFGPARKLIAWMIATSREKTSQAMYAKIGGGSPIRRLTDEQSQALEGALEKDGKESLVRTAFTCSDPLVEDVVKTLYENGVRDFLAFPLYPQYSFTTTKGSHDRAREAIEHLKGARYFEIRSWPTQPSFIAAHVDQIRKVLSSFTHSRLEDVHLIFSAHSIPEKLVTEEGDPYKAEMEQSVKAILESLAWKGASTLSWQSKLGPVKWLEPATEDVIRTLGKNGTKSVLVIPIAFVTDHIETLYELDMMLGETAREVGIVEYKRTPGLNDHPLFIQCLKELASAQRAFWS